GRICRWRTAANSRLRAGICGLDSRPQTTDRQFRRQSFALQPTQPHVSFPAALPPLLPSCRAIPASQNLRGPLSSALSLHESTRVVPSANWRGNAHHLLLFPLDRFPLPDDRLASPPLAFA